MQQKLTDADGIQCFISLKEKLKLITLTCLTELELEFVAS